MGIGRAHRCEAAIQREKERKRERKRENRDSKEYVSAAEKEKDREQDRATTDRIRSNPPILMTWSFIQITTETASQSGCIFTKMARTL